MSSFYGNLQSTAKRLMKQFKQGAVYHVRDGDPTGDPWNPQPGVPIETPVDATVSGVSQMYVGQPLENGTMISQSDLVVTIPDFGLAPLLGDRIKLDGVIKNIIKIDRIPAAGTVIAWRVFIR